MSTIKERLKQIADFYGFSIRKFEEECLLGRGNISNMGSNSTLGSDKLSKIIDKFPNVSANWLLNGKGDMLKHDNDAPMLSDRGTPYYDVDFCGGFDIVFNDQTMVPAGYINIPQYSNADNWANITGHSMEPLISNGDIIALHKVEDWQTYILYGEVYGVMTDEYRTVKRLRRSSNPDKILLEPINKDYDTQEIPRKIITGMWLVLGCAKKLF